MKRVKPQSVYGILGFPLQHTLSPAMHQAAYRKLGLHARYLAISVAPQDVKQLLPALKLMPLHGFNVTVPYKETILQACDTLSSEAKAIGAVNTVKQVKAVWKGYNTDVYGFEQALRKELRFFPRGKKCVIIGSGGAARACVWLLAHKGAKQIWIANRTQKKAKSLARSMSRLFKKTSFGVIGLKSQEVKAAFEKADAVIQTTSLGLKKTDKLPVAKECLALKKKLVVMDLIYNPAQTPFLKMAKRRGHLTANGLSMLLYQGVKAFEIMTGRQAPIEVMRRALKRGLQGR